jgi:hypothetical protein
VNEIALPDQRIGSMSIAAIDKVRALEEITREMPQEDIVTWHVLHGGVYSRTIEIKADVMLTGALVKVPTTLTVNGDIVVFVGDDRVRLTGYQVLPASAGRKQAFIAIADTMLTMAFRTDAKSIHEAEEEFTDDASQLMSRKVDAVNFVNITGE